VGIARKDSSGDTASVDAESIPYLSHPKYLPPYVSLQYAQHWNHLTLHDDP
jgi:hypothetical protein